MNMLREFVQVVTCVGVVTTSATSESIAQAESGVDPDAAAACFAEARELSGRDGGSMWGIELYGPMLFVDRESRRVVANAPDAEGILERHGDVYVGVLPEHVNVANTSTDWAGVQWAMVVWPLPQHPEERGLLMMHESFHRIQPKLGLELAIRNSHHLEAAEGRIWMRLEWRALATALEVEQPLLSEALRDALYFRAWRKRLLKDARIEEAPVELNEGLAEYTGTILSGYSPEEQRARAIRALRGSDRMSSMSRTFAYTSGPPYGLLLDEASPGWQRSIAPDSDLGAMLAEAIQLRYPRNLRRAAADAAVRYDGEAVRTEEEGNAEDRAQTIRNLTARFMSGAHLRIPIDGEIHFTFNPHGALGLEGVGTVYSSIRITGPWGIVDSKVSVLWVTESQQGHFRIALDEDPNVDGNTVSGEGWVLTLTSEAWRVRKTTTRGDFVIERNREAFETTPDLAKRDGGCE